MNKCNTRTKKEFELDNEFSDKYKYSAVIALKLTQHIAYIMNRTLLSELVNS